VTFAYSNTLPVLTNGLDEVAPSTCVRSGNMYMAGGGGDMRRGLLK